MEYVFILSATPAGRNADTTVFWHGVYMNCMYVYRCERERLGFGISDRLDFTCLDFCSVVVVMV
jgi:hypothetical protein